MEKVVAKRKVCHKAWRKSKSAEDKHTLDVAKKEVYNAVMTAQESKLQEFTADLQSESGRKNCFRIAREMAREGRDVISVCCMKNYAGIVVSDADGMQNIWRMYMQKLLNVENDWDGEVDCPEVMGPHCLISEEEVAAAIKGLKIGKAAGPTGVVSEMMKAAGGFGSRWMTDLINNIVKEGCIPDDWRKSILVLVYKVKGDPLVCVSYRAIKLLEQPMKVLERVLENRIRCQVSIDNMQFGFMPGKGTTDAIFIMRQVQEKHQTKKKKLYYAFVDLEKAFDRAPREVVRWVLRKLGRCSGVRGGLSRVADGFRCRRCDGTIQEVDLADDLMMDGETYECVKSFCYLGDTLDGDGGVDLAATARIRNGWMKFRELLPFLTSRAPPLEIKGRVYASCVRSSMTYGSETTPLLVDVGLKFERAEMQMIRWMCGISLKDRRTNEELRRLVGVEPITTYIRSGRLRWYGHVMRKGNED